MTARGIRSSGLFAALAFVGATAVFIVGTGSTALAEDAPAPAAPYSGDFLTRSTLTGDWGGARNDLAAKGVTFDLNATEIEQGVVDGGKSHAWQEGGRANLTTKLDTQKLGLWPGGFLTMELEGNWNDAVGPGRTGALMPSNSSSLYPVPGGDFFAVPQLSFAQFLSPYAGVILGKLDATSGDANVFAHGKGDEQFFNLAFQLNPALMLTAPYSTLGTGLIVLPTKDPEQALVTFSVLQGNGTATTVGFDDLSGSKLTFAGEARVRTDFFDLTGHQLLGGTYSNKTFTSLDQRLGEILGFGTIARKSGSWAVYYNFDQFLYETDKAKGKGIGLFGRFATTDGNPNPIHYFASFGLGAEGLFACRPHDRMGIGYYYMDINSPRLDPPVLPQAFLRDEHGFETYYNVALTPWMLLTFDLQVVDPSQERRLVNGDHVETDVVLGVRQQILF